MLGAPFAALIRKGGGEALGYVVMVMVPYQGNLAVRQFPDELGQVRQKILAPGLTERVRHIVRPGENHILGVRGKAQAALAGELGLIGENGGDQAAEILSHRLKIALVGHLQEPADSLGVQGVYIGLVIVPGVGQIRFHIGIPFPPLGLRLGIDAHGALQAAIAVQGNIIAGQQTAAIRAGGIAGHFVAGFAGLLLTVGIRREQQVPGTITLLFGYHSSRGAGGPTVLIVEPGQHVLLAAFFHTGLNQLHEFIAQVGRSHAGAHMHMGAAHAHFLEHV